MTVTETKLHILKTIAGARSLHLKCPAGVNEARYVARKRRLSTKQMRKNFSELERMGYIRRSKIKLWGGVYEITAKGRRLLK